MVTGFVRVYFDRELCAIQEGENAIVAIARSSNEEEYCLMFRGAFLVGAEGGKVGYQEINRCPF